MPRRDNGTRWNSWYLMLDWAITRIKGAIVTVTSEESNLEKDQLTAEEWRTLVNIRDFLQSFYDATKATEGHQVTLEQVIPTMDFLAAAFEDAIDEFADHKFMRESLQTGYTKLLKYWNKTERSPAYIAAVVLDPTTKWEYFDSWDPDWRPNMKAAMKEFWETKYRSSTGRPTYSSAVSVQSTGNKYLDWRKQKRGHQNIAVSDELDQYLKDPMVLEVDITTVLTWWLEPKQRSRFPLLSKMAIDIYSVPAMSSEPERVFSKAKHTVSEQRNGLKAETIEMLECLKSWFRLGIFTEEDLHAIVAQQGDMTLEEALDQ